MSDPARDTAAGTLSWGALALALAVGAGAPLLWWWMAAAPAAPAVAAGASQPAARTVVLVSAATVTAPAATVAGTVDTARAVRAAASAPRAIPRLRDPNGDLSPDITDFINAGEVPTMAEVISRLHAAGVRSGLGAFSPPGTRPPLIGVAVSDDFELPPGYVRHHQVTDDGQRIEPILMYAPDHPLMTAGGQTALLAQDRVVPPDRLPAGLPVRMVVVPPPAGPGK